MAKNVRETKPNINTNKKMQVEVLQHLIIFFKFKNYSMSGFSLF